MLPLTVELETVTPLFLGGAEPRGSPPELRAASVRGALRYWLRGHGRRRLERAQGS
jgi:CRISPR-associated protein Cmr1